MVEGKKAFGGQDVGWLIGAFCGMNAALLSPSLHLVRRKQAAVFHCIVRLKSRATCQALPDRHEGRSAAGSWDELGKRFGQTFELWASGAIELNRIVSFSASNQTPSTGFGIVPPVLAQGAGYYGKRERSAVFQCRRPAPRRSVEITVMGNDVGHAPSGELSESQGNPRRL